MEMPPLTKRVVLGGVSLLLVIVLFTIAYSSESGSKSEEFPINLTEDVLYNPFLQDRELWKVNQAMVFAGAEDDWSRNEMLNDNGQSLEMFMEHALQIINDSIELTSVPLPEPDLRPENVLINVKSSRELTMLKAAGVKVHIHTVQTGESLWDISRIYGIDVETIVGANQHIGNINKIKPGQELRILNTKGVIHKVSPLETLSNTSKLYGVSVKKIMEFNGLKSSRIKPGDELIIPGARPSKLAFKGGYTNEFIWPTKGPISSPFGMRWGRMHNGIDIVVGIGTPIRAAKSGKVQFSGVAGGYGNAVYLSHDDKTVTRYGHNSDLVVKTGEYVYQGQIIAYSGNSGVSTGPHLHFEIRISNKPQNPMNYLKK